jgi:hypothetical protein
MRVAKDPLAPLKAWVELFGVTPVRKEKARRQWEISIVTSVMPKPQPILVVDDPAPLPKP